MNMYHVHYASDEVKAVHTTKWEQKAEDTPKTEQNYCNPLKNILVIPSAQKWFFSQSREKSFTIHIFCWAF